MHDLLQVLCWTRIHTPRESPLRINVKHKFFRFFKTCLQISSRNCHFGYTIWTASFQILFWIGYYLCFSWRLAIVNTHRYLLKSDDFLTSLYNDRAINLPDTLEDAEDTDRQKSNPENQKKSDKKGTSQKK